MTDLLRKNMAPISDNAWLAIEAQATLTLKGNLALRAMVDFSGPTGPETAAIGTGKLKTSRANPGGGLSWGIREVLPLIEVRVPFKLSREELDSVERGADDPDLDALIEAARGIAVFEEKTLLEGLTGSGITGIAKASSHKPIPVPKAGADAVFGAITSGILALEKDGINGPYALVLGDDYYQALRSGHPGGFPIDQRAANLATAGIRWSPAVKGGILLSRRGGDFKMTSGQDIAIGYQEHDVETVTLFLTESFTFRVLEPAAAIVLGST